MPEQSAVKDVKDNFGSIVVAIAVVLIVLAFVTIAFNDRITRLEHRLPPTTTTTTVRHG